MKEYDLIVIGTGPAGEKAAVKAAYFGHKVAIIEKELTPGGTEVADSLPSKSMRETAVYLSGKYDKGVYGIARTLDKEASFADFMYLKVQVSRKVSDEIRENLVRHQVDIYRGIASFDDPHTLTIQSATPEKIRGKNILIATGSYPFHPPQIPFDNRLVHDSDSILMINHFPASLCVVGAGVIGCEYTTIFATMGTKVHLVNDKSHILPFTDNEISTALVEEIQQEGVKVHFNATVEKVEALENSVRVTLKGEKPFEVEMFLFAAGRCGNTKQLQLDKIGISVNKRETIDVDDTYRTQIPHIYAVGDVIGFPSLVSTGMDQGRVAVSHMFQTQDLESLPSFFPYGIYTIPEVSMVGITEEEAQKQNLSYYIGKARYSDLPRGQMMGIKSGFLKLIITKEDHIIRGVHIIGPLATEIIHFGLILLEQEKTIYSVIGTVFNFPTLHDLYKYAAYDGLSNFTGHKIKP